MFCLYDSHIIPCCAESEGSVSQVRIEAGRQRWTCAIFLASLRVCFSGDADIYFSYNDKDVSFHLDKHDASSATCGLDYIDVASAPRPSYLAVGYLHFSSSSSLQFSAREFMERRIAICALGRNWCLSVILLAELSLHIKDEQH